MPGYLSIMNIHTELINLPLVMIYKINRLFSKQGQEKPAAMPTNRSNALYYYKQALTAILTRVRNDILKSTRIWVESCTMLRGSIRLVHPLASLRLANRYKFKQCPVAGTAGDVIYGHHMAQGALCRYLQKTKGAGGAKIYRRHGDSAPNRHM